MRILRLTVALLISISAHAQDTGYIKQMPEITLVGRGSRSDYHQMPEKAGTHIYAGKKNALIVLDNVQGNVATNNMRQVLSKVAGIHIWESDPSGIQIAIAARGLSPNRSWEFNIRQNGYDIAADPYGYPEAYYNPPLQAVQRIEIVRGQGALQYGPQFGGMVNYILRNGSDISRKFRFESQQTVGSNGLFNTYNAVGGKGKKIHYYSFFNHRNGNGYRENSRYFTNAGFGTLTFLINKKTSISAEIMQSHIRSQQPGGLTDIQVKENPVKSLRSRNWLDIEWTTPAVILNYNISEKTKWNTRWFATIGNRNSVGFLQVITVADTINKLTGTYNNRLLNMDKYRNYGMESRFITSYKLGKKENTLSAGIRLYKGQTYRLSNGKGSTGSDYDMTLIGQYDNDIKFASYNAAAFAENIFRINNRLIIIPGIRLEWLQGRASGRNGFTSAGNLVILQNIKRSRKFVLAGLGTEYHFSRQTELYGNISQAYRPIQFANLQAPPTTDVVDENLKDAKGYNIDIGYRGKMKSWLQFDISVFYLQYNNRVGAVTTGGTPSYRLITNAGNSTSRGIEAFAEWNIARCLWKTTKLDILVFSSYAYNNARYSQKHKDAGTRGKMLENAPQHILRSGLSAGNKSLLVTLQVSHCSSAYSDVNNTIAFSANGNTGLIPEYTVADITASCRIKQNINLKAGINNLTNVIYFTRRAGGYPGPGALPADGRTAFISAGFIL